MSSSDRSMIRMRLAHHGLASALVLALAGCAGGHGETAAKAGDAQGDGQVRAAPAGEAPSTAVADAAQAVGASSPPAAASFGARQLDHPDDLQMLMLAYRLEGQRPPIADWAAAQARVAVADEFERPAWLAQEQQRLQEIYDGTAGIGSIRMNVNARFGEYDAGRGGYYLDAFVPGNVFTFEVQPAPNPVRRERITLQVDNREELNFWPLDPAAAKDVLGRNSGQRNVTLDSRLQLTGIHRRSDGRVISARLLGYAIGSDHFGRPASFGERSFEAATQASR